MPNEFENDFRSDIINFLKKLERENKLFQFNPVINGNTTYGNNLQLGFSCYVLKCYHMLGLWDELEESKKTMWIDYINSFQKDVKYLPQNSFIDDAIKNYYESYRVKLSLKNFLKKILASLKISNYKSINKIYLETVRAETKQAIATIFELGNTNKLKFTEFPRTKSDIENFLNNLNWNHPWTSGAQFAAIAVFTSTQLDDLESKQNSDIMYSYLDNFVDSETGLYLNGNQRNSSELINGAMKVLSGLDWLQKPIHYPKELIDFCLKNKPKYEGCDIVDMVYVLYRCSKESDYRKEDIQTYFEEIKNQINLHYHPSLGGFSYFQSKSQNFYYGLKITDGNNEADLHGTTLLLWAYSMIENFNGSKKYKVIKP
tara:strand:- start:11088 stop:12203 length:1116 start_codon:yes stop_codon:yes gene_type:complete